MPLLGKNKNGDMAYPLYKLFLRVSDRLVRRFVYLVRSFRCRCGDLDGFNDSLELPLGVGGFGPGLMSGDRAYCGLPFRDRTRTQRTKFSWGRFSCASCVRAAV